MGQRIRRIGVVAVLAWAAGCSSTQKPHARDPLLRGGKVHRGNFDAARTAPDPPDVGPEPPANPTDGRQYVVAER